MWDGDGGVSESVQGVLERLGEFRELRVLALPMLSMLVFSGSGLGLALGFGGGGGSGGGVASERARVCGVHPAPSIPGQIQHACASLTPGTEI